MNKLDKPEWDKVHHRAKHLVFVPGSKKVIIVDTKLQMELQGLPTGTVDISVPNDYNKLIGTTLHSFANETMHDITEIGEK